MSVRDRQHRQHDAPTAPSRREQAAELRERAASVRDELAAAEAALQERRDADEAGRLERQAAALDLDQDRDDRAGELRDQADAFDAAAADLATDVERLDSEILDAVQRAASFGHQLAVEFADRRRDLEQQRDQAAAAGDTDGLLAAERNLALLPAVEQQLQAQADTATTRADELNGEAGRLESIADHHCRRAALLRRHADTDALAPLNDRDELPADQLERVGGRRIVDYLTARGDALRAVRAITDLHAQDRAALAATFTQARANSLHEREVARRIAPLDPIGRLVEQVRDAAIREAAPGSGALEWIDRRDTGVRVTPVLGRLRRELADAVAAYRDTTSRELRACWRLATSGEFTFASDVTDAAADALDELKAERDALQRS